MTESPLRPLRPRHDGWTPERQAGFVVARAGGASIAAAAAAVGMSRRAAYRLRAHPAGAGIAAAWPTPVTTAALTAILDDRVDALFARPRSAADDTIDTRTLIRRLARLRPRA